MAGSEERERREGGERGEVVTLGCPLIIDEFMAQLDAVKGSQYFWPLATLHLQLIKAEAEAAA